MRSLRELVLDPAFFFKRYSVYNPALIKCHQPLAFWRFRERRPGGHVGNTHLSLGAIFQQVRCKATLLKKELNGKKNFTVYTHLFSDKPAWYWNYPYLI